ncbi:MAG: signal peptidase I [Nanoarchaeota archaeon]|nr:signal peptidase I [Nanoarchaeota archaeon]
MKEESQFLKKLKKYWEKFWFIVWKDDSFKGWIFSIIFLFLFIKFIFFPILSLTTGTGLPLAIVESCSMYHDGNLGSDFDGWWEKHSSTYTEQGIEKEEFQDYIFNKGFNKGDILFIVGANPKKLEVGDVIIFDIGSNHPIIHRIVNIKKEDSGYIFSTMGDNVGRIQPFETSIKEDQLIGKAVFKLAPYLGWGKLIFFEHTQPESKKGLCDEI